MIGTHVVTLSEDTGGSPWSDNPVNTNPWFDTDASGWQVTVGTWANGGVQSVAPYQVALTSQPPGPGPYVTPGHTYLVATTVTLATAADVTVTMTTDLGGAVARHIFPQVGGNQELRFEVQVANKPNVPFAVGVVTSGALPPRAGEPDPRATYQRVESIAVYERVAVSTGPVDLSCLVDSVSIHHGREDPTGQPEASTATLNLSWDQDTDSMPVTLDVGAQVKVETDLGGQSFTRFLGRVSDISYEWDEVGPDTPQAPMAQVVATGYLAGLGRRVVGDAPFPNEWDGARVKRVLNLAGVATDNVTSDYGTVVLLPRDVDSQPALDVAHDAAESGGGMVWETRDGSVRYADSDHRRNTQPALHLDACDVLVTPKWMRSLEGLVNKVSVGYGVTPDGGEQPRYVASNASSITRFGEYAVSETTELYTLPDAQARASVILARNSSPTWVLTALPIDMAGLDAARTATLLGLDMHALLAVTDFPTVGAAPTSTSLWVEGWTERLAAGVHELELFVSGYCRSVPPPRWDDADPSWTWDSSPAAASQMQWDQATCFGPPG